MKMAARYPHGAGFRGTAALSSQYLDARWLSGLDERAARSSHNTFMSALVEQGIIGALLYLWLWAWGVMVVARLKALQRQHASIEMTAPAVASCVGIAVVWTAGQFTDYLMTEVQFWLFAVLAASLEHIRLATAVPKQEPATSSRPQRVMGEERAT
jgi:hypothetical protein